MESIEKNQKKNQSLYNSYIVETCLIKEKEKAN